jgi:RimJ/RimL family protein N-acetyltransferase
MALARHTDRIESERLILPRIEQADFAFFARIHADPLVARYLGCGRARSVQETHALLETFCETYEELGPLAVLRKSDGVLFGRCGSATWHSRRTRHRENGLGYGISARKYLRIRTLFLSKNLDIRLIEQHGLSFLRRNAGLLVRLM